MKNFIKMAKFAKVSGDKKTSRASFYVMFVIYMSFKHRPNNVIMPYQ